MGRPVQRRAWRSNGCTAADGCPWYGVLRDGTLVIRERAADDEEMRLGAGTRIARRCRMAGYSGVMFDACRPFGPRFVS